MNMGQGGVIFARPSLTPVQQAWLNEMGVDGRLLRPFIDPDPRPGVRTEAVPAVSVAVDGPVAGQVAQGVVAGVRQAPAPAVMPRHEPIARAKVPPEPVQAPREVPVDWSALQEHVSVCQACDLHAGRAQTVFGSGTVGPVEWLIVGEAPGERDDRAGLPFQGRPGELLKAMLDTVGVGPESRVFYTNIVKCKPRGNRIPRPEEVAACRPYLERQIALARPRRILALGWLAAQALTTETGSLEALRGRVHWREFEGGLKVPIVATYHPASLLLRPRQKADAWRDLNLALSV